MLGFILAKAGAGVTKNGNFAIASPLCYFFTSDANSLNTIDFRHSGERRNIMQ